VAIKGFPTEEELDLIREAILLPVVTQVIDHDMKAIERSEVKFKQIHMDHLQSVLDKVIKDLGNVRKELRKRSIKLYGEERDEKGMGCQYNSRGYHASFDMTWPTVKAYAEEYLRKYMLK
jgi:hypothetical protein